MKKIFKIEQIIENDKINLEIECPDDDFIKKYFEDNEIILKIKGAGENKNGQKIKIKHSSKNEKKMKVEILASDYNSED